MLKLWVAGAAVASLLIAGVIFIKPIMHILSVDTDEITETGYRKCPGGNGISPTPGVIELRLNNVFNDLKDAKIERDVDYHKPNGPIEQVSDPQIASDWSTNLDMKFEKPWLKDGFVVLRIMLLQKASGQPHNEKVEFLTPKTGNRFDAVRKGKEAGAMICGHSVITQMTVPRKNPAGKTFNATYQVVDIYFKNPSDAQHVDESINIGLLVGPPNGKRLPVFLDPKVHNEGYP